MKDKNKKIIIKKKVNLILNVRIIILYLVSNPVLFFIFFNWTEQYYLVLKIKFLLSNQLFLKLM